MADIIAFVPTIPLTNMFKSSPFPWMPRRAEENFHGPQGGPASKEKPVPLETILGYLNQDQFDRAIAASTTLIRVSPNNPAGYAARGYAQLLKSDYVSNERIRPWLYREIATDCTTAIRLDPKDFSSHFNLARVRVKQERYHDAIKAFNDAIRLRPNNTVAYEELGQVYEALGMHAEAMANYAKAQRLRETP